MVGGGEAGADRARRRLLDVGVLQDHHGVLSAEFEGDADQPGGGGLRDLAAGAGGAGERDVVGVLDDLGADDRALAEDDLEDPGGQTGLDEEVTGPEGGQAGLRVGLHDDRVARREGRERVADGELERVVPGGDLPNYPAGVPEFGDLGEGRDGAGVPLRLEVGGGLAAVVAGRDGDGLHLLVRVQPRLAGLQLDQVEDLGLPGQHQIVEAEQDRRALPYRRLCPQGLRGTGRVEGLRHVLGVDSGRSASFSPVNGEWLAVRPEPTTPFVSWATSSGVTTSAAVRAPVGLKREGVRAGRRFRAGLFQGLRVRHVPQGMPLRRVWVPVGNRDSRSTHITPVITGNECPDQGVVRG